MGAGRRAARLSDVRWRAAALLIACLSLLGAAAPRLVPGGARSGPPTLRAARELVAERVAAVARAAADAAALTGLRTQSEILAERYDHAVLVAGQDALAYRAAVGRLDLARAAERTSRLRLAQQAAADYETDGGPDMAAAMFAGAASPGTLLGTLGVQQVLDSQRADLAAAGQADAVVTRLFARQAAALLARQRAAVQTAGFLKQAVSAAVSHQVRAVKAAAAARARLTAALAAGRASIPAVGGRTAADADDGASVLAGGPPGAASGVTVPDWSPSAGATARQGDEAADWALTQLGKPYQWGGAGPASYDCSGLAMDAWASAGVTLPHWTGYQWVAGPHVPLPRLRRGDLVFYATSTADPATIHHVGIYLGRGLIVDAPYTGAPVRIDSIHAYSGLIGATRPAG
jgi:cell wall-associated NlpC family hydrolase